MSAIFDQPVRGDIREIERDGRRWLQQWRPKGKSLHEFEWLDVAELAPLTSSVTPLRPRPPPKA